MVVAQDGSIAAVTQLAGKLFRLFPRLDSSFEAIRH